MTTVIKFPEKPPLTAEAAWQSYVRLREKADRTLAFEDGRAAAKAWVRFYTLFVTDDISGDPA